MYQRQRLRGWQVRQARGDALGVLGIVQIGVVKRQRGRACAGDAARGAVAQCAHASGPVDLHVGGATPGFPAVNAAFAQVAAHEGQMLAIGLRVAGHAPLHAVFGQMAVAQQNAVQARIVFGKARHRHHFGGNGKTDVVAGLQLASIDPGRGHFAFIQPRLGAGVGLAQRHALNRPERMRVGDLQRFNGVFHVNRHHRLGLVIDHAFGDFAVLAAVAQHQIACANVADGARALRGIDQRVGGETLVHRHRRVIHDFEEWHHALRFAVGAFDMRTHCAHRRPVVAQATGKFRQQRVFLDRVVNAAQIVGDGGQVAR